MPDVKVVQFWAGLVIAVCGLVTVFMFEQVYLGFGVALIGTGILPVEKFTEMLKR